MCMKKLNNKQLICGYETNIKIWNIVTNTF